MKPAVSANSDSTTEFLAIKNIYMTYQVSIYSDITGLLIWREMFTTTCHRHCSVAIRTGSLCHFLHHHYFRCCCHAGLRIHHCCWSCCRHCYYHFCHCSGYFVDVVAIVVLSMLQLLFHCNGIDRRLAKRKTDHMFGGDGSGLLQTFSLKLSDFCWNSTHGDPVDCVLSFLINTYDIKILIYAWPSQWN